MKIFSPFGLYQKLLAGYLFLLFILIVPCVFSLYSIYKIEDTISTYFKRSLEISSSIEYAKNLVPSLEAEARRLVILHKGDSLKQVKKILENLKTKLSPDIAWDSKALRKDLTDFQNTLELLRKIIITYENKVDLNYQTDKGPNLSDEAREQEVKGLAFHLMELLKKAEFIQKASLKSRSQQTSRVISQVKDGTILLMLVAFVVALFVPWALYIYIKKPIRYLQKGTEAIGGGNFDHKIPVISNDELGELARSFNNMAKSLKELDTLKSDFIAVASHELKTPLAAMLEATRLLREPDIGELNERQTKLVEVLNTSMERFKALIEELLDLSKMQAGLLNLNKKTVSVEELVQTVRENVATLLSAKNLKLLVENSDKDISVDVDPKRMERVLLNLLDNAITFSPENGIIKIDIREKADKKRSFVQIAVVDSGPGLESHEQTRVFEKFYQAKTAPRQSGSGLGLTIARQIISAHGGKIWIESPPPEELAVTTQKGTAVFILLPL